MVGRIAALSLLAAAALAQPFATNADERLAGYIEEALKRHPAIHESLAAYRSSLQRIPQVTALPEPRLGITQYARSPETRVGPQTTTLSISQRLPWFGKLSEQGKVAAKEAEVWRQAHETSKSEIVRQVKQAYYELAYIDQAIAITEQDRGLLGHFEKLAQARYAQGVGLQQAVVKLQAEITRDASRLQSLLRQRVDAEAALNMLRDLPPETSLPPVRLRFDAVPPPDLQALYAIGRRQRPEIRAAFHQIERNEKRIHAARKNYWPDFTVGAGFTNVNGRTDLPPGVMPPLGNGKNIYSFTVGVDLPLRRRKYDAGVLEATEGLIAAREGYRKIENRVEASIRSLAHRMESVGEQISLFEKVLLPQAEHAVRSTEAAYSSGSLGVLELLDSERTSLEVRLGLARLQSDYMKALADMERATGAPFPSQPANPNSMAVRELSSLNHSFSLQQEIKP